MATQTETVKHAQPKDANQIISNLPNYLRQFIVDQRYESYTPQDHAIWRYVMRQNVNFLKDHAHRAYLEGLSATGIGIDKIPSIDEMNAILGKIGWAAVTVDGFIPPYAFMTFQALNVLVIAADLRQIHHIEYTPAPDIIHEAAGHAPIIADPEYAEYLRRIGFVGSKAMSSKKDFELYEAIRRLSILKETPNADPKEVDEAEKDVHYKQENLGEPSEMALLSRLHWWTVEYGLIGDLDNFKIYGAGILSSLGESFGCLSSNVKKLWYNLDTANYAFDITTTQPQLFVTPTFKDLNSVLDDFSKDLAYKIGGLKGIEKAIECKNTSTCQYSSGLQVSGVYTEVLIDSSKRPAYLKITGPTALAYDDIQLKGHDKHYHKDGFGSPVGRLNDSNKPLEDMTDGDLEAIGIKTGKAASLNFESGVKVEGHLDNVHRADGKILLMTFSDCKVTKESKVLFDPAWGTYDMAVGHNITSVFNGAADKDAYEEVALVSRTRTVKVDRTDKEKKLFEKYQSVREVRDGRTDHSQLPAIWEKLQKDHSDDWLASLEILEILLKENLYPEIQKEIRQFLEDKAANDKHAAKVINDGLKIVTKVYSASGFAKN